MSRRSGRYCSASLSPVEARLNGVHPYAHAPGAEGSPRAPLNGRGAVLWGFAGAFVDLAGLGVLEVFGGVRCGNGGGGDDSERRERGVEAAFHVSSPLDLSSGLSRGAQ